MVSRIELQKTTNSRSHPKQSPEHLHRVRIPNLHFAARNKCGIMYDTLIMIIHTMVILALLTVLNEAALCGLMIL